MPYLVSNAATVVLLLLGWRWPRLARLVFGVGFLAAAAFNVVTAIRDPQSYVTGFGPLALAPYRKLIYGPFAAHVRAWVLAIAAGQAASGALLLTPRFVRLGAAGACLFLLAIAPLGVGSAFPATPILAVAVVLAVRRVEWSHVAAGRAVGVSGPGRA